MNYQFEVEVKDIEKVWRIGDRFYKVSSKSLETFRETCPVCDGTKKVEIRGHEFPCPYCQDRSDYHYVKDLQSIVVFGFDVIEYIVNGFEVEGEEKKGNYPVNGEPKDPPRFRRFKAFTKWGSSYNSVGNTSAPRFDELDQPIEKAIKALRMEDLAFSTAAKAKEFASALVEREKARLAEFNEKFGCSYEYPEERS